MVVIQILWQSSGDAKSKSPQSERSVWDFDSWEHNISTYCRQAVGKETSLPDASVHRIAVPYYLLSHVQCQFTVNANWLIKTKLCIANIEPKEGQTDDIVEY